MTAALANPVWVPVTDSERPEFLYHGIIAGRSEDAMNRKLAGVIKNGLRPRKSKHKDAARDTQSLVFLFDTVLSAEVYAGGGPIFEVRLDPAAPLYRDTKLTKVGAMFTTEAVPVENLRRLVGKDIFTCRERDRQQGRG